MTTKGATRPLESWKIETSFALTNNDSQQLIIVDMISNCPTKKVLAMQWDTHEASKCWCSSTSIEQSMSVLQKCLFCSVIARSQSCSWKPYGTQREVVQKFERVTFLVWWLSYKWQENISFSMLGKWQLSLSSFSSRTFSWLEIWHFEGSTEKFQKMLFYYIKGPFFLGNTSKLSIYKLGKFVNIKE